MVRDILDEVKLNQFVSEKAERPASLAFGWFATSEGNQMGFVSAVELALILAAWSPAMEGSRNTLLHELFANARNSGLRDLNRFGNSIVDPGLR